MVKDKKFLTLKNLRDTNLSDFPGLPDEVRADRKRSALSQITCYVLILAGIIGILCSPHPIYYGNLYSKTEAAIYMGFIRNAWSFVIIFLIIACEEGYVPAFHKFLGADIWLILNRLGYTGYLVQSLVIYYWYDTFYVQFHVNMIHLYWMGVGNVFICLIFGYLAYIFSEAPFAGLVGILLGK